jgi:hypothetical protein
VRQACQDLDERTLVVGLGALFAVRAYDLALPG